MASAFMEREPKHDAPTPIGPSSQVDHLRPAPWLRFARNRNTPDLGNPTLNGRAAL
jgi:hypothetical protein